jgi:hypothetical protein
MRGKSQGMRKWDRGRTRRELEDDRCRNWGLDTRELMKSRRARGTHACPNPWVYVQLLYIYII